MRHKFYELKLGYQSTRLMILGALSLTLFVGCGDIFEKEKKQPMINPEHNKEVVKTGQKYRMFVVGGTEFLVPNVPQFTPLNTDGYAGFHLRLAWPDIPPGKFPNTEIDKSLPDDVGNQTTNLIVVQVQERPATLSGDGYQSYSKTALGSPSNYVFKDDLELGLNLFANKGTPNFFNSGYSIKKDVTTPYYQEAVLVKGEFITFLYTPSIYVRIKMIGWSGKINPNWKDIYTGVVETLNNYQEEAKK